jgi:hypothetical protein
MSIELVKAEIAKFLASAEPGVLCLRGRWGVGKTYTWNERLNAAQASKRLAIKKYAYVSLFGVNTLEALKFAVFENSQNIENGVRLANAETLSDFISSSPPWQRLVKLMTSGSWFSKFADREAVQAMSFMSVRNQIVCFDDFERRGDGLKPKDVLGLISTLKEQRGCKVVLILNDEHLEGAAKSEFETHLEKVADVSLVFEPSASQAAAIGVGRADETSTYVGDRSAALGVTNIRTVKRALQFVENIKPMLARHDPEVLLTAVRSLVLFCWCRDEPQEAPPLDFVEKMSADHVGLGAARRNGDPERDETRWTAKLHAYGYMWTDGFDVVLIEAVRKGFFDGDKLEREALVLDAKLAKGRADGSLEAAWRKVDHSFDDDEKAVLDGIRDAYYRNIEYVTPATLNGTVTLFKRFGRVDQAAEMIAHYVQARGAEPELFELEAHPFGSLVDDPDVTRAFDAKAREPRETPDFVTLLGGAKEDWSTETIEALAAASVDDYRRAFKSRNGEAHRRLVQNALHFMNVGGATPAMQVMTAKARDALLAIAAESPFNAFRAARFGVVAEVPEREPPEGAEEGV